MNPALTGAGVPTFVLYVGSLVLVAWTVFDVARRPPHVLTPGKKAAWIVGSSVGWLLFGIVGAFVAIVYLVGPRKRMNTKRW
jgi:hypothetical protein